MNEAPPVDRQIPRLFRASIFLGLFFCLLSLIPFDWMAHLLGRFEVDGVFDSLRLQEYQVLEWGIRIFGLVFIGMALVALLARKQVEPAVEALRKAIHSISLKEDGRALWLAIRGDTSASSFWLVTAALVFLAVLIRLALLEYPVRYDEAYTFIKFSSRPLRYILTDYSAPNNHILHSLLVSLFYHFFGMHLWALRLPALLAGVLSVVAAFLAGRRLYGNFAGIVAAAGIVLSPMMIDFSVNARGYSLLCFFALIALWLAAELIHQNHFLYWALLVLVCGLGFYTIPIFLYPAGIIFLWLGLSAWMGDTGGIGKRGFFLRWLLAGLSLGALVFLLYLPVLLVGTGLHSITSNEFVGSLTWQDFFPSLLSRIKRVWQEWNDRVPNWISLLTVAGFFLHVLSSFRRRTPRVPVYLAAILWIGIALLVQRVTPLPRMWIFLLGFYLLWSAAGWCWFTGWMIKKVPYFPAYQTIALIVILAFTWLGYRYLQANPVLQESEDSFNAMAAGYIADHIPADMPLVGVSPTTIQISYYLMMNGIPYNRFYDRDRPEPITQAWVVVVNRSKFPAIENVLAFQQVDDELGADLAVSLFSYKRLSIYQVSTKP